MRNSACDINSELQRRRVARGGGVRGTTIRACSFLSDSGGSPDGSDPTYIAEDLGCV